MKKTVKQQMKQLETCQAEHFAALNVSEQECRRQIQEAGALLDNGVWRFPDESSGRFLTGPNDTRIFVPLTDSSGRPLK